MVESLAQEFSNSEPFPHVVIERFLTSGSSELATDFPEPAWAGWRHYGDEYQRGKMICSDLELMPSVLQSLVVELSAPRFLKFLESLSDVEGLITDPYLEGGGLHCSGPGGILEVHTDFHLYPRLQLYRRLNLLLYINDEWDAEWGGCLEMYDPAANEPGARPVRTVVPRFGTCVIFKTDRSSPHGFTRSIVEGHWRRSIALYYYTAMDAVEYGGDTSTHWRQGHERSLTRRLRQHAYRGLILGSRALAFAAHRVDPRLGQSVGKPR